jgi:protoheme ferro-lyase
MKEFKTGVLLLQLGTPDSPATKDVRKYLRQFLIAPREIDLPNNTLEIMLKRNIARILCFPRLSPRHEFLQGSIISMFHIRSIL